MRVKQYLGPDVPGHHGIKVPADIGWVPQRRVLVKDGAQMFFKVIHGIHPSCDVFVALCDLEYGSLYTDI